jgi:hypothetical protein
MILKKECEQQCLGQSPGAPCTACRSPAVKPQPRAGGKVAQARGTGPRFRNSCISSPVQSCVQRGSSCCSLRAPHPSPPPPAHFPQLSVGRLVPPSHNTDKDFGIVPPIVLFSSPPSSSSPQSLDDSHIHTCVFICLCMRIYALGTDCAYEKACHLCPYGPGLLRVMICSFHFPANPIVSFFFFFFFFGSTGV